MPKRGIASILAQVARLTTPAKASMDRSVPLVSHRHQRCAAAKPTRFSSETFVASGQSLRQ